jgi:hypothetical protein
MKYMFALALTLIATPAAAQESLFSVEASSPPAQLALLDAKNPQTQKFQAAWNDFQMAWLGRDRSALIGMISGAGGVTGSPAEQERQIDFLLGPNAQSPFQKVRIYTSISSRTYPTADYLLGWAVPANYTPADRAALAEREGGEAIGCICTGPGCNDLPVPKTSADTRNNPSSGFACARMILAPNGSIRFEVDVPGFDEKS